MDKKIFFGMRDKYVDQLDEIAKHHDITRADLLREIILHYLGIMTEISDPNVIKKKGTESNS